MRILRALSSPKNLQQIATDTGIIRTSVAYNLKVLGQRGFVIKTRLSKRPVYTALSSAALTKSLQRTIDIQRVGGGVKRGVRIKTTPEDEFTIHVGPQEIVPAFTRIATEIKGERVKAIQHHKSFNDLLEVTTPKQLVEFNHAIIKNNIIIDGILNEGAYQSYFDEILTDPKNHLAQIKSLEGRMSDYSVFPDNCFDWSAEIWIFKTTTLIISWKDEVAIEIINKNMTNVLRQMFEYVKQSSKKIDHNEMMRELITKVKNKKN